MVEATGSSVLRKEGSLYHQTTQGFESMEKEVSSQGGVAEKETGEAFPGETPIDAWKELGGWL